MGACFCCYVAPPPVVVIVVPTATSEPIANGKMPPVDATKTIVWPVMTT
jgi:hypothetical protein